MIRRPHFIRVLFALLLIALFGWGIRKAWRGRAVLWSDPTAKRDDSEYAKLHAAPKSYTRTNFPPITGVIVITNNSDVQIRYPDLEDGSPTFFNYSLNHVSPQESLPVSGGNLKLNYIGVAYGKIPTNQWNQYSFRVPLKFYYPDSAALSAEETRRVFPNQWSSEQQFTGRFPTLELLFDASIMEVGKILNLKVLDARTKKSLSSGYSSTGSSTLGLRLDAEVEMWHSGPVEVVLDLAFGPVEVYKLQPVAGARLSHPLGELEVLGIVPGANGGWSMSGGSMNRTNTIDIGFNATNSNTSAMLVLASRPQASFLPIDFQFIDHQGKPMTGNGGGVSGNNIMISVGSSLSNVDYIKASFYTKSIRVILPLSALPGLPRQNASVSNLFDVVIPNVLLKDDDETERFLREVLQLELIPRRPRTMPAGFYPKYYENVTPRVILNDYLKGFPKPLAVRVDQASQKVEFQDSLWIRWWAKIRGWF